MSDFLIPAAIVAVCIYVWFLVFVPVARIHPPQRGKIEPEQPWPAPPAPPGLCPTCGKDRARLAYLTVDCDEYVFKAGRCYQYEQDTICPREPRCHDKGRWSEARVS